jgi:hypothetical protein
MELWSNSDSPLDRDEIDPLLARVANNAAVVTFNDIRLRYFNYRNLSYIHMYKKKA